MSMILFFLKICLWKDEGMFSHRANDLMAVMQFLATVLGVAEFERGFCDG
jgi:hypothetical protein